MKKFKPVLALLLVFVAGIAVGVVGTRVVVRGIIRRAMVHPEMVRETIERDLTRRLRLDAAQRQKVHEALLDTQSQLHDLRLDFQPKFAVIVGDAQGRISAILTPEQREKFEKFREENRRFLPVSPLTSAHQTNSSH